MRGGIIKTEPDNLESKKIIIPDTTERKLVCSGASISAEQVSKSFGKVQALDKLSLKVDPDTIFALLGPNGSGKTTLEDLDMGSGNHARVYSTCTPSL